MPSFFIPLSGLQADSTALNTIANNLANMNTTAYKEQTVNFADLFYQQVGSSGSGDPIQQGAGTKVSAIQANFTGGTNSPDSTATDMAISGNGFFVLNNNGTEELTRDGNFTLDANGYLTTQDGVHVMGYPATAGVANTSAPLTAVQLPVGQAQQPKATANLSVTANLDAGSTTAYPAQATIYDSLGVSHIATITYTETGTNTWGYTATLPASDFTSGVAQTVTGTLGFDKDGNLSTVTPNGGTQTNVGTAAGDTSSIALNFTGLADGSSDLTMNWNLVGSNGKPLITQVASDSTASTSQDGYPSGEYNGFTVTSDGSVEAQFSNGKTEVVGQLALGNVINQQGLQLNGNGVYTATTASGTISIGASGSGGLGTIQDDALEQSNVNISTEFSNLVIAQRAFEANSKAVTTFDTVTQDTISMIH